MKRLSAGVLLGGAFGLALASAQSFAASPPSYMLFGTINPVSVVVSDKVVCDVPSLIQQELPFAGVLSNYYKDAQGVHISFSQAADFFEYGLGDTDFAGWVLLNFSTGSTTSGTVSFDASPWTYTYNNQQWQPVKSGFAVTFAGYSESYSGDTLSVSFNITARDCTLPIVAVYHNFGK